MWDYLASDYIILLLLLLCGVVGYFFIYPLCWFFYLIYQEQREFDREWRRIYIERDRYRNDEHRNSESFNNHNTH